MSVGLAYPVSKLWHGHSAFCGVAGPAARNCVVKGVAYFTIKSVYTVEFAFNFMCSSLISTMKPSWFTTAVNARHLCQSKELLVSQRELLAMLLGFRLIVDIEISSGRFFWSLIKTIFGFPIWVWRAFVPATDTATRGTTSAHNIRSVNFFSFADAAAEHQTLAPFISSGFSQDC